MHRHTASAAMQRTSSSLRSRSIGVALLAVRARAAVKRALAGETLSDRDISELSNVRRVLAGAAEAIGYDLKGSAPAAKHITSVGLALSAVAGPAEPPDKEAMSSHLRSLVADLDRLIGGEPPRDTSALPDFLTGLLRIADRDTSQSGETLVRRA